VDETLYRLVTDNRSGVTLDVGTGFGKRPAICLKIRSPIMYLDRGQYRKTLIRIRDELTRLLRNHEKPLKGRKPPEVRDPAVCRDCGYLLMSCRCE
jgi:hypothetical protein